MSFAIGIAGGTRPTNSVNASQQITVGALAPALYSALLLTDFSSGNTAKGSRAQ